MSTSIPTKIAQCRATSCQAPIYWLRHARTGKLAPINATPSEDGNCILDLAAGTYSTVLPATGYPGEYHTTPRYRQHHTTCPARADFKEIGPGVLVGQRPPSDADLEQDLGDQAAAHYATRPGRPTVVQHISSHTAGTGYLSTPDPAGTGYVFVTAPGGQKIATFRDQASLTAFIAAMQASAP